MAGFLKKISKVLFLIVLAAVAIPVGIVFTVLDALLFTAQNLVRTIWSLIYGFFRSVSKVISVCSGAFLTRLLTKRGVPFGTYSVSAVLGANQREKTLSNVGAWLAELLDSIEANHCKKASENAGI
jgi:hypothetical protein